MNIPGNPTYNLLEQAWIPVRDEDGTSWMIAPHDLVTCGPGGKLPVALHAERPDFNGALAQFLIGLVQTAFAPASDRDWRRYLKAPPDAEALRDAFACYRDAFHLDGDGPRFMQSRLPELPTRKELQLLQLGAPSENAIKKNKDLFVKQQTNLRRALPWSALALYCYQINVPRSAAGKGYSHHSTLRGGGAVTTLVLGQTLWETIWWNVLDKPAFLALAATEEHPEPEKKFPWLTSHSSETRLTTNRGDIHPSQLYWPMPRRIWLNLIDEQNSENQVARTLCNGYYTEREGIDYRSPWIHPLSPCGAWNALPVRSEQFTYQDWTTFTMEGKDLHPALVVSRALSFITRHSTHKPRLWVFGFEMAEANIRAYREAIMPLYLVASERREQLEDLAATMVKAADQLVEALKKALKKAFYGTCRFKNNKVQWDFAPQTDISKSILVDTVTRFWRDTEPDFHNNLQQFTETSTTPSRDDWDKKIKNVALDLFDEVTQYGVFRGLDPKSVVKAREELKAAKPKL
jgi:CRISPR system Cascade subunit CasA